MAEHDEIPPLIVELTLFPKSDKRVTLVRENVTFIKLDEDALEATQAQAPADGSAASSPEDRLEARPRGLGSGQAIVSA